MSLSSEGAEGTGPSVEAVSSGDGRYVAFASRAANLVAGDTNGAWDVFVRDRSERRTTRISINSLGAQGDGPSRAPSLSADGRFVAFASLARTLVAGDANGTWDVFLHDRNTQRTERVSAGVLGGGTGPSVAPAISADGRYVAFESAADNLVAADRNGATDVFLWDRLTGNLERVSARGAVEADGPSFAPAISADGRYVAFESVAGNLVAGDQNGALDVFVWDRTVRTVERVSVGPADGEGNGPSLHAAISADGRYVAFESAADNLIARDGNESWDVFVHDRRTGITERASVGQLDEEVAGDSGAPAVSSDGRFVVFQSTATDLVSEDVNELQDVFVRDRILRRTVRVSVDPDSGEDADGPSANPALSADGARIVFDSGGTNLAPRDWNATRDAFAMENALAVEVPAGPVAEAGPDRVLECAGAAAAGTPVLLEGGASSAGTTPIQSYEWLDGAQRIATGARATVLLATGVHAITLVVTDEAGLSDSDVVVVEIVDTTPPDLAVSVSPLELWPPDHRLVEVTPQIEAVDGCSGVPLVDLTDVRAYDEPGGAGHTAEDVEIDGQGRIYLRAERSGTGFGRTYVLTYTATDSAGNVATAQVTVVVPHDP